MTYNNVWELDWAVLADGSKVPLCDRSK